MQKSFKSFTQYIAEAEKEITFTFGRLNPPTVGHGKLLDSVARVASVGTTRRNSSNRIKQLTMTYGRRIQSTECEGNFLLCLGDILRK